MLKYALLIGGSSPTLYIDWPEKLNSGDEIEIKRSEVKYWRKDFKIINKLFLKNGKSEKPKDRDVNNYIIKVRIGSQSGGRCLEEGNGTYEGLSVYLV
jgi:RIO-like serine/threonine protein kinase